jgi:Uma2 family endonuclease
MIIITDSEGTRSFYNPELIQIIDGKEVMPPTPMFYHQLTSGNLWSELSKVTEHLGRLFFAPLDVIFEETLNVLQPDLMFVSKANSDIVQDWIRGIPDLTIEIVSEETFELDTIIKKDIYERYGVPECWLVFPKKKIIEIYSLFEGKYELHQTCSQGEIVDSLMLPGIILSLNDIFE